MYIATVKLLFQHHADKLCLLRVHISPSIDNWDRVTYSSNIESDEDAVTCSCDIERNTVKLEFPAISTDAHVGWKGMTYTHALRSRSTH